MLITQSVYSQKANTRFMGGLKVRLEVKIKGKAVFVPCLKATATHLYYVQTRKSTVRGRVTTKSWVRVEPMKNIENEAEIRKQLKGVDSIYAQRMSDPKNLECVLRYLNKKDLAPVSDSCKNVQLYSSLEVDKPLDTAPVHSVKTGARSYAGTLYEKGQVYYKRYNRVTKKTEKVVVGHIRATQYHDLLKVCQWYIQVKREGLSVNKSQGLFNIKSTNGTQVIHWHTGKEWVVLPWPAKLLRALHTAHKESIVKQKKQNHSTKDNNRLK